MKYYTWVQRKWDEVLFYMIAEILGDAWFWMLGLGVIHIYAHAVPALGYWIVVVLRLLFGNSSSLQTPVINMLTYRKKLIQ